MVAARGIRAYNPATVVDTSILQEVERHFASGDYRLALTELDKIESPDPMISQLVSGALSRMRAITAREFMSGRWTAAEEIMMSFQAHGRLLSPMERAQCEDLVARIWERRADSRTSHALVKAAAMMAAEGRYPESREVAVQVMSACDDPVLVARLGLLLLDLPHPLGRLIFGADSALEVERYVAASAGARIAASTEETHLLGGGFARVTLDAPGEYVSLLDPPQDWSGAKELNFWVRPQEEGVMRLTLFVGDSGNAFVAPVTLREPYWDQIRLSLASFAALGAPSWGAAGVIRLVLETPGPASFDLDEVRLK